MGNVRSLFLSNFYVKHCKSLDILFKFKNIDTLRLESVRALRYYDDGLTPKDIFNKLPNIKSLSIKEARKFKKSLLNAFHHQLESLHIDSKGEHTKHKMKVIPFIDF